MIKKRSIWYIAYPITRKRKTLKKPTQKMEKFLDFFFKIDYHSQKSQASAHLTRREEILYD
ncbi:MAG: hypothetical protein D6805_06570 [Planctomycetota bacterium]|nr:MAG: hypothetical protein D6805_06570 [Planctomycetota bacterium]